jgi:hypothetical protein
VPNARFRRRALFVADDANAFAAETAEAAQQRFVFAEFAVAGERREIRDELRDIIGKMRPLRVAGHLRLLPRRQIGIDILQRLRGLRFETRHFVADRDGFAARGKGAEFFELGLELRHRFFKIEISAHHRLIFCGFPQAREAARRLSSSQ